MPGFVNRIRGYFHTRAKGDGPAAILGITHNPVMRSRDETLLDRIEDGATDSGSSLGDSLRKCVVLGGRSESQALQDWATRELKGYYGEDELPDYRIIQAQLTIDGATMAGTVTGQPIPRSMLPDFVREDLSDKLELRQGAGELEEIVKRAESVDEAVKLSLPLGTEIAQLMGQDGQVVMAVYWSLAPAALRGVLDQIRTSLAQLVAELRATLPDGATVPSAAAATEAVNFIITGNRNTVNVTKANSTGVNSTASSVGQDNRDKQSLLLKVVSVVAGIATIAGTVVLIVIR